MKKLGAFFLTFLLGLQTAFASPELPMISDLDSTEWLTVGMTDGISLYQAGNPDSPSPTAPEGLEEFYRWMEKDSDPMQTLYLAAPKGRVLASVSRTPMPNPLSAVELLSLWPRIAANLEKTAMFVDTQPDCAGVITWNDREWLAIETLLVLDGEDMISVELFGYANCDKGVMVEIWLACPSETNYLYEESILPELEEDISAMANWLNSLQVPIPQQ